MRGVARVCLAIIGFVLLVPGRVAGATVDPRIWEDIQATGSARFLVVMRSQAPVAAAASDAHDRQALGLAVYTSLRLTAERTQSDLVATLAALGVSYRAFWVANAIEVEGGRALVEALAARPDVLALESDRPFRVPLEPVRSLEPASRTMMAVTTGVEWNVTKINAPAAWALGYTGQGVVFASADTGVEWTHPALKSNYAGWNGTTADHNYHWWDGVKSQIRNYASSCGYDAQAPCDDFGHGTGTTGTAVGSEGANNQIGVAPGAKWIACRNMDTGMGRPTTYLSCLQFFLAPTDLAGANPDPSRRPDVIANSYSSRVGAVFAAHDASRHREPARGRSAGRRQRQQRGAGVRINRGSAWHRRRDHDGRIDGRQRRHQQLQ